MGMASYGIVGSPRLKGILILAFLALGRLALGLHLNPVVFLKVVGVVGLFLLVAGLFCLSRLWMPSRFAWIPCLWLLAYRGQIIWSVSGLETTLYEALVVASLLYVLRGVGYSTYPCARADSRLGALVGAGVTFALASLTRPEAPALFGLIWLFVALQRSNGRVLFFQTRGASFRWWICYLFLALFSMEMGLFWTIIS